MPEFRRKTEVAPQSAAVGVATSPDTAVGSDVDHLRVYTWHGMSFAHKARDTNAYTTCPRCGREGKFGVVVASGLGRCVACDFASNPEKFGRYLLEIGSLRTDYERNLKTLAAERKILSHETLAKWGVSFSSITAEALVPGWKDRDGKTAPQVYRYVRDPKTNKRLLLATPGFKHGAFGLTLFDSKKSKVIVAEGPWDGMVLWEAMRREKGFGDWNVVAIPGALSFPECLPKYLSGKEVYFFFDNDHRRTNPFSKATIPPAGLSGIKKASGILMSSATPPKFLSYLKWGTEEEQWSKKLEHGYDVRDYLTASHTAATPIPRKERAVRLLGLIQKTTQVPSGWIEEHKVVKPKEPTIESVACDSWEELNKQWQRAMHWTPGLRRAFAVGLACIVSTEIGGEQLWLRIVSPAASGKSTLCEAWSVSKRYTKAVSTLRGFHSGYQSDSDGEEDNSLLALLRNKTLVVKDGDTLLQAPNRDQILAEARDIYDRVSRSSYRNKVRHEYDNFSMTWILCGTSSLRSLDSSELGQRFLDCIIMKEIDEDLEDEILWRKVRQAARASMSMRNGKVTTQDDPSMVKAKQLTGGYIEYLRDTLQSKLEEMSSGTGWESGEESGGSGAEDVLGDLTTYAQKKLLISWGKFVAYLRARPSKKQDESVERELATRLVSQLTKLAYCLVYVLQKEAVDTEIMEIVRGIALDTAEGKTLDTVNVLYESGETGKDLDSLCKQSGKKEIEEQALMRFLRRIGVAEHVTFVQPTGKRVARWRLTPKVRGLYEKIYEQVS